MVAGDHHGLDPGSLADLYRLFRLLPRRVHHPHEPQKNKIGLDPFPIQGGACLHLLPSQGQDPQALARHLVGGCEGPLAILECDRIFGAVPHDPTAEVEDRLRRSFHRDGKPLGRSVDRRHPPHLRVEGKLHLFGKVPALYPVEDAPLGGGDDEGPLSGIADDSPAFGPLLELRVVAEGPGGEEGGEVLIIPGNKSLLRPLSGLLLLLTFPKIRPSVPQEEGAFRAVAGPGNLHLSARPDLSHHHFAPGQGTGLVGTDHSS